MCGIAGIADDRGLPADAVLQHARDLLAHRGPDDVGLYTSARRDAALLFRRLSIIDLSPAGHQPLSNEDGRLWIVFNGEVYNFERLRAELEGLGHHFRSRTDSEVIVQAYEQWGTACVQRFIGMFAFAIWDEERRTLFAARDRLGIKPLYYQRTGGSFRFASELKSLVALPGGPHAIDREALWHYLARGYVSPPRTIYQDARSVPPGHFVTWTADSHALEITRYWDPVDAYARGRLPIGARSPEDASTELEAALRDAVQLRLRSDVPIGAFLSGGIDSSVVAALMASLAGTTVKTFTIRFAERAYDEAPHARKIAAHLGTDHHELHATEAQAMDFIPRLAEYYDEPFADSSALPTYLISLLARQHVTVALSGDGGDELFGGYEHYRTIGQRLQIARRVPAMAGEWLGKLGRARGGQRVDRALASLPLATEPERFFDYYTSIWRPFELERLVPGLDEPAAAPASRLHGADSDLAIFTMSDLQRYLPDDILTKVDRASMAVSLEARVPLLDHRVVEFVLSLADEVRVPAGRPKALLRSVLSRYLPDALVDRPKQGFGVPLDAWLRGPLRGLLTDYLAAGRLRREGLFDPQVVETWVDRFLAGEIGHARVWVLLVYQMWAEQYRAA